jgi:hypothetical protein
MTRAKLTLLEEIDHLLSAARRGLRRAEKTMNADEANRCGGQVEALEAVRRLVAPDGVTT